MNSEALEDLKLRHYPALACGLKGRYMCKRRKTLHFTLPKKAYEEAIAHDIALR